VVAPAIRSSLRPYIGWRAQARAFQYRPALKTGCDALVESRRDQAGDGRARLPDLRLNALANEIGSDVAQGHRVAEPLSPRFRDHQAITSADAESSTGPPELPLLIAPFTTHRPCSAPAR
jgi:hypothetical protein